MAAVLQTVVKDRWDSTDRRASREWTAVETQNFREAMAYVASPDRGWPFSFLNLCDALALDPMTLRNELLKAPRA